MPKRLYFFVTVWAIFALLLSGCGDNEAVTSSAPPSTTGVAVTTTTTIPTTEATLAETDSVATEVVTEDTSTTTIRSSSIVSTTDTTESKPTESITTTTQKPATSVNSSVTTTTTEKTKESTVAQRTSATQTTAVTTEKTTVKTSTSTATTTSITTTTTTATTTTSATTTTTTTTTTTAAPAVTTTVDPNRVTINGKEFAVGDVVNYTVMVKTAKNYGTVKIGIRCLQKGLAIPDGTFQKQNQYVMKNIGIGRFGSVPEDTVGNNGFSITAQKGYALDAAYDGYAGLLWYYETTDYDWDSMSSRNIDCSEGVALFTLALKITKPGDYLVECTEYPSNTRTDLTVWGEFS